MSSLALGIPMRRGKRCVPPALFVCQHQKKKTDVVSIVILQYQRVSLQLSTPPNDLSSYPGMIASLVSTSPILTFLLPPPTLISQHRAISNPPPRAAPSMTAMVGIGKVSSSRKLSLKLARNCLTSVGFIVERSCHIVNKWGDNERQTMRIQSCFKTMSAHSITHSYDIMIVCLPFIHLDLLSNQHRRRMHLRPNF